MQVISRLHITAGHSHNTTYLKNSYCTQPFKICNITEDDKDAFLRLMLMSSSPGILDKDHYQINIEVEENAQLHLTTQGYQRIFTMLNGANQTLDIRLNNNASLTWLPHPVVPHKSSKFKSNNNIYLNNCHNLMWSEIVTCGRKLCNEVYAFTSFQNITNVYLENRLVIKENILLEPLKQNICGVGQLENFSHHSTLMFLKSRTDNEYLMHECREFLLAADDIEFGISALPVHGFIIRMLAHKGEQLFNLHKQLSLLLERPTKVVTV